VIPPPPHAEFAFQAGMQLMLATAARDVREAARQFRKAAMAGHVDGMAAVAYCYKKGWGLPRNMPRGRPWALASANGGSILGMHELASYLEMVGASADDSTLRAKLFAVVAEHQEQLGRTALGLMKLGSIHSRGDAVPLRQDIALEWMHKAEEAGDVAVIFNLASAYLYGKGTEPNLEMAVMYLRRSATFGDPLAHYQLGELYRLGRISLAPDHVLAHKHLLQAALAGNSRARCQVGIQLIYGGNAVARDLRDGARWIRLALKDSRVRGSALMGSGQQALMWLRMHHWSLTALMLAAEPVPGAPDTRKNYLLPAQLAERYGFDQALLEGLTLQATVWLGKGSPPRVSSLLFLKTLLIRPGRRQVPCVTFSCFRSAPNGSSTGLPFWVCASRHSSGSF
jgi:TPR repeat protein